MISSTAIFASSDILATLEYYKEVLGFDSSWTYGDPPVFGSASKGEANIMFSLNPELAAIIRGHQHWLKVDDIDDMYHFHRSKGAEIVSEIEDKPWGFREYVVEDLNGYHLRFVGVPEGNPPDSKPFPEGVTIERRKPTEGEHRLIAGQAFGYHTTTPGLLERTWSGVVALSPDGDPIGVVRIMWDAPGWFSIWDVAVVPEWQANRIGSKMMTEALNIIREASPGANVHLFTYKHGFYERLGFKVDTVSIRRL